MRTTLQGVAVSDLTRMLYARVQDRLDRMPSHMDPLILASMEIPLAPFESPLTE